MNIKNKDIKFGDVEIDDSEFEPRNVKVRITTFIDQDILIDLRKISKTKGQKYQTLLNQILRAFCERRKSKKIASVEEKRIRQIVQEELRKKRA